MGRIVSRALGLLLIVASTAGLLFSMVGIVGVWRVRQRALGSLTEALDLLHGALGATSAGLTVADDALGTAETNVESLEAATGTLSTTIHDTIPLTETAADLVGSDLPASVASIQTSLTAAESSARIVDDTLTVVTTIPFYPGEPYAPDVPLHVSIANTSASLDDLTTSFSALETNLRATGDNLVAMETQVQQLAKEVGMINASVGDARDVIGDYQAVVNDLQTQLDSLSGGLPRWLDTVAWFLSFVLVWLGITQVGLFLQGLEWIRVEHLDGGAAS